MAVDASKLRRSKLGSPPTEGMPGIEQTEGSLASKDGGAETALPEPAAPAMLPEMSKVTTRRQRVPPAPVEPLVPFTSRVRVSTKDRLEAACFHLRQRHQEFVDAALVAYLEQHGF
jgi:hypothetical protein